MNTYYNGGLLMSRREIKLVVYLHYLWIKKQKEGVQARFNGHSLMYKKFKMLNFKDVSFKGTFLYGCRFENCNLEGCDFRYSDLRKVQFIECNLKDTRFEDSIIENTMLKNSYMNNSSLLDIMKNEQVIIKRNRVNHYLKLFGYNVFENV